MEYQPVDGIIGPLSTIHAGLVFNAPRLEQMLNEAAIAEKHPSATSFNNIIHPHPERDFFVLYHEDES